MFGDVHEKARFTTCTITDDDQLSANGFCHCERGWLERMELMMECDAMGLDKRTTIASISHRKIKR